MAKGKGQRPQQQHLVPEFYLKRFTESGADVLYLFDVDHGTVSESTPKNILKIRDFYTVMRPDGEKDDTVESILSRIETDAASVIDEYTQSMCIPQADDWQALCAFVAMLDVRTTNFRQQHWWMGQTMGDIIAEATLGSRTHFEQLLEESHQVDPEIIKKRTQAKANVEADGGLSLLEPCIELITQLEHHIEPGESLTYEKAVELYKGKALVIGDRQTQVVANMLHIWSSLFQIALQMKPRLLLTTGPLGFITSDAPLVKHNILPSNGLLGNMGWICDGIRVYVPLSQYSCLELSHDEAPGAIAVDQYTVAHVNSLQAIQCNRFLVSGKHGCIWLNKKGHLRRGMGGLREEVAALRKKRWKLPTENRPFGGRKRSFNPKTARVEDGINDEGWATRIRVREEED